MFDSIRSETTIKESLKQFVAEHTPSMQSNVMLESRRVVWVRFLSYFYSLFFSSSVTLSLRQLWNHLFLRTDILQASQTEPHYRLNKLGSNDQRGGRRWYFFVFSFRSLRISHGRSRSVAGISCVTLQECHGCPDRVGERSPPQSVTLSALRGKSWRSVASKSCGLSTLNDK